jgi:hypothetical protein
MASPLVHFEAKQQLAQKKVMWKETPLLLAWVRGLHLQQQSPTKPTLETVLASWTRLYLSHCHQQPVDQQSLAIVGAALGDWTFAILPAVP